MASFPTCANPDGEEEVGDAGGKHGEGKTCCCDDCTENRHSTATVFVHKAARDGSWKVKKTRLIQAHSNVDL